jgi:hypothetical protein
MFVTTKRASAWLDSQSGNEAESGDAGRRGGRARTLYAVRPFETPAGRCIALKLVPPAVGRAAAPRFFVLFVSLYERCPVPRWVPVERVLEEADVERWLKEGFRR